MAQKFIEWNSIYSVGIEIIDNQHKRIFELINEIYNTSKLDFAQFEKVRIQLNNYANYHFRLEEKLFEITHYPQTNAHLQEHNEFREKIKQWNEKSKKEMENELFDFLVDWLIEHILNVDMKYAPYIKKEISNNNIDVNKILREVDK